MREDQRRRIGALHTDEHRKFVEALADARRDAGISQHELARLLGRDQTYVSKYEKGRQRLDVIEFLRIVTALGVEPMVILNQIPRMGRPQPGPSVDH
jgi:predicted transcriptional regulator